MESTVKGIWNAITDVLDDIVNAIVLLLPASPFKDVEIPAEVKQLFGYVNNFVPVTAMLAIGTTWLTAIGVYYKYNTQMGENNQVNAHGAASVRAGRPMRIGVDFL